MSAAMPSMTGMVRRARNTAPTPEVSAIVWRKPYFLGISKSSRVAAWPPTWITLMAKSAPSRARRRSVVALIRPRAPSVSFVQRAIATAVSRRSSSMSCSTISASASSGKEKMSPSRLRVNSTLPAPMNAILVMRVAVLSLRRRELAALGLLSRPTPCGTTPVTAVLERYGRTSRRNEQDHAARAPATG